MPAMPVRGVAAGDGGRWLVAAANVAAALALVATVYAHVRPEEPAPAPAPLAAAVTAARPADRQVDATAIAAWRLFGGAVADGADGATPGEDGIIDAATLPPTALDMTLKGVASATREEAGYAIIGTAQAPDRRYRVGDTLPGETALIAVLAGAVVIDNGGRRELLALPAAEDVVRGPPTPAPGAAPLAADRAAP